MHAETTAFAACEALFTANPDMIIGEEDGSQVLGITVPGGRIAPAGTRVRLVRHVTALGVYYRLYPEGGNFSEISLGGQDTWVSGEIAQELAAAVVR